MSDQGLEQAEVRTRGALTRAAWLSLPLRAELPASVAWATAGGLSLLVCLYFVSDEDTAGNILFTIAVTLSIGAVMVLAWRRILFAAAMMTAFAACMDTAAYIKGQASGLTLHAYEVVSLVASWSALMQFCSAHRDHAVMIVAGLAATAIVGVVSWRLDATRVRRAHAAAGMLVCVGLATLGAATRGERRHTEFYFERSSVSFFYASWAETIEAMWRGHLIEASSQSPRLDFSQPPACTPARKRPHILLIHQESVVPPQYFPTLDYDRSLDRFFLSGDGLLRKLRVETFGGASWLTEFSLLTGLSSQSFGGMQQFVQPFMTGRLGDSLPRVLARCGYRNVMFYPMLRNFVNSGKFFSHVGFGEIRDARDQGAKLANERDRFYYGNALGEVERHVRTSADPLFLFIETMATHGGYDYAYMPEVDVRGGGPGTHPEMHEYLRRLGMARMDYVQLRRDLAQRFPREQFLIVHYGDHQPTATRMLLGFDENASVEDVVRGGNPAAFETYYAVDAVGYRLPPLSTLESLDVAYLGTVLLEAAGLPLGDIYGERRRLMQLCSGRYHDCPEREQILTFHRRLIDAGLLDAR